mmetsp:Transcript_13009/g.39387  ORF Transcript_13009/g.39387 Transcript_13009/m.39387 type:complete len:233 (-) Transcript_13009:222-920(-)|eukprot:CAMPEP_0206136322 /NCGR_PEP_ID=MMETSP1473-20131121/1555_1 /ASSEMBLY_ACC=CAM_ASM_001109 /TAXON_ID=1461547 /ORGANISM="Stichococcus sp, Strain RCC1054" /LENGTH=232 /DNA_ID=CAMNT_0053528759 /DNA_START=361 /DNA_END=1059 /DNA_ORIENTATION=-
MTTAHRPTIVTAKGGEEQGGRRIFVPSRMTSAKDAAAHTKLKFRQDGQNSQADLKRENQAKIKAALLENERKHFSKGKDAFEEERNEDLKLLQASAGDDDGKPGKLLVPKAADADDADASASDDDDSDDESDDEAQLLAELARIKAERAEEAAKAAAEAAAAAQEDVRQEVIRGNPLVLDGRQEPSFEMKRRWDDDVVFKNQDRGAPKKQQRFINDTIRSDFHRRFLERYVK